MSQQPSIAAVPETTAATRLVVLLGHPVAHSRSPQLHSAAFAAANVDAVYVTADVAPADLPAAVAGVRSLGALGANVTVPHKVAVMQLVDLLTEEATAIGACNTLYWHEGALVGDNTDAVGLQTSLLADVAPLADAEALIFGAGGAARAAAVALGRLGASVRVRARRPEAASTVQRLAIENGARTPGGDPPRLVVNATPLGLDGEALPDDLMALAPGQVALDLLYGIDTPFLRAAREAGAATLDGTGMLLGQAAAAFRRWTDQPPPFGAYLAAAEG